MGHCSPKASARVGGSSSCTHFLATFPPYSSNNSSTMFRDKSSDSKMIEMHNHVVSLATSCNSGGAGSVSGSLHLVIARVGFLLPCFVLPVSKRAQRGIFLCLFPLFEIAPILDVRCKKPSKCADSNECVIFWFRHRVCL